MWGVAVGAILAKPHVLWLLSSSRPPWAVALRHTLLKRHLRPNGLATGRMLARREQNGPTIRRNRSPVCSVDALLADVPAAFLCSGAVPPAARQNSRAAVQMQGEAPPDCCHRRCEAFMPCMFAQSIIIAALAQHHAIAKSALGCKRS
ncbi:hypothetical protein IQ06DRAFT_307735 [Phaeosphaeriaceae sp. SRC1lsM3a]|nr:hypothetical protein IQ06DRAFT_307735 [Stagonospora sp. SRC1lsM3a]